MLEQAIANLRALASQIASIETDVPAAARMRLDVASFAGAPLDGLERYRGQVLSYANDGVARLGDLAEAAGTDAGPLASELAGLRTGAQTLRTQALPIEQGVQDAAERFDQDSGALSASAATLAAQAAQASAQRDAAAAAADKIAERIKIVDGISSVFPIVGIADEVASLITNQKLVEQTFTEADARLQRLNARCGRIRQMAELSSSLSSKVLQLARTTQSLGNATRLVSSQLATPIGGTSPALAKLAALTLVANLKSVAALAS